MGLCGHMEDNSVKSKGENNMEIIFELLYEIIIEGAMGILKDKDFPIGLRIGAGALLFIPFAGILALVIHLARKSGATGAVGWTIVLSVIALTVIILMISVFIKPPKDND